MPPPRKRAFSKLKLREAIDRLRDATEDKNFASLAQLLNVNPNLLYAWRKEGEKELKVSPTVEDAIKLACLEKQLGLANDDDLIAVCLRWLKLSARDDVSEDTIRHMLFEHDNRQQVKAFEEQLSRLYKEGADISPLLKVLVALERKITIGDLLFLEKVESNLGFKMTVPLAKELFEARR